MKMHLSALACAALLAACGGGGDGGDPVQGATPAGLWTGSTDTNRASTTLILSDGTYWGFYSVVGNPSLIAGFVNGKLNPWQSQQFTADVLRDYNFEGLGFSTATVFGLYNTRGNAKTHLQYANGTSVNLTANYDSRFEQAASLATLAGTYGNGQLGFAAGSATITTSGAITGTSNGCAYSGQATPRTDANAYEIAVTFGGSPCVFAGQTLNGILLYDANTRRVYAAAPTAARNGAFLAVGVKQ